jgi:FAD/FMN-containing dehydrogenase
MAATTVGAEQLDELRGSLSGRILGPSDDGYEEARRVHNGLIDRRPALIAQCRGAADIADAVRFARRIGLDVCVRGGGHNVAGRAVVDDALMIDLSQMKGIHVDRDAQTVRAQGGVLWRELNREIAAHGLATTGGAISTTGIAGLTLGGGLGWLMAKYGLAADNVTSVELVTADGSIVNVTEDSDRELFWGLRGGGGNFGIATSLEYRLHPVGPMVLGGPIFFAGDRAEEVLSFYRGWVRELPDDTTTLVNLTTAPPAPFLPEEVHGKPVVAVVAVHAGDHEQGRAIMQPLKDLGDPVADLIDVIPYVGMQSLLDPLWERGAHNYFRSAFVDHVDDAAVKALVARHADVPSPHSEIHIQHFGGAVARVGDDESAFGNRSAQYVLNVIARSPSAEGFEDNIAWARGTTQALAPVSRDAAYVNFMGDANDQRLRASYGDAKYERLVALKRRYDPTNLFRLNQNITP